MASAAADPAMNEKELTSLPIPRTDEAGAGPVQSVSMRGCNVTRATRFERSEETRALARDRQGRWNAPVFKGTTVLDKNAILNVQQPHRQ